MQKLEVTAAHQQRYWQASGYVKNRKFKISNQTLRWVAIGELKMNRKIRGLVRTARYFDFGANLDSGDGVAPGSGRKERTTQQFCAGGD